MPNNPRGGGVSRRVEGEDRQELRDTMDQLELPQGMSIIARTAGIGRSAPELQWDLNYLMQLWRAIEGAGNSQTGAFLIYQESSLVIRAIRDYFQPDIGELLIDTDDVYEQAHQFMAHVMPDMVSRVKRYRDDVPLFSRFQIEHQIETAHSRHRAAAVRWRDRHRSHRGAGVGRRQLGPRHARRRHRGDRDPHQPRSGR
jgi:ribonuclease E